MKNIMFLILDFLKRRTGETFFSLWYGTHLTRGAIITYKNFEIDIATIVAFCSIAIFIFIIDIWLRYKFENKKDQRIYHLVIWGIHITMILLIGVEFLYLHFEPAKFGISVFVYWFFEFGYHLYKVFIAKRNVTP